MNKDCKHLIFTQFWIPWFDRNVSYVCIECKKSMNEKEFNNYKNNNK